MSLICMCVYATHENKKFEIAKKCMASLLETVDLTKHRLIIINQNSIPECKEWLSELATINGISVIHLSENIGTARGINLAMKQREVGEYVIKSDDDLAWLEKGWVDMMESEIRKNPQIGILGIKRDDVYGEMVADKNLLWCHDIFGTCTMYNPAMIDKLGTVLVNFGLYGYDDSTASVRSEAAGFRNAFMRHIKIENLDLKETPYTEWKRKQAGIHAQEAGLYMQMVKSGELSYYYEDEE